MKITIQLLFALLTIYSGITYGQSHSKTQRIKEKGLLKNQAVEVSGMERNYHLFVPDNPVNAPIVLLFHGNRGSHDKLLGLKRGKAPYKIWLDIAKRENIIIAVPNGVRGAKKHRGWNDCREDALGNPELDDVLFVSTLIDFILKSYQANAAKVYVVGTSNGGHMALRLAQEIPQKLTAFGAIVAANSVNSKCLDSNVPVSALFINGTSDPILPYMGGQMASNRGEVHSIENTIAYWVKRNKTDTIPVTTHIADVDIYDNSTIEKQLYTNGKKHTEIAFYKIVEGGHTEPSRKERYRRFFLSFVGNQNGDLEMAEEIWTFFKAKKINR